MQHFNIAAAQATTPLKCAIKWKTYDGRKRQRKPITPLKRSSQKSFFKSPPDGRIWGISQVKGKKKLSAKVGFDKKMQYFLALRFIGLQRTEHLPDAALITSHGASSLPGTHQPQAACCLRYRHSTATAESTDSRGVARVSRG